MAFHGRSTALPIQAMAGVSSVLLVGEHVYLQWIGPVSGLDQRTG